MKQDTLKIIAFALIAVSTIGIATTLNAQQHLGATPWVVIKCKFSDQPQEPLFDPTFITGSNGMAGYWSDLSFGQMTLAGTDIYGWFTLPYTLAEARTKSRHENITACINAANSNGVSVVGYYSVIAVINAQVDSGSSGGRVLLDPAAWNNVSFTGHEMGHGYNLDHSFDDTGTVYDSGSDSRPGAYGDGWDIMSAMNFGNSFPTFMGTIGTSGPGLNALNMDQLGWIPANRKLSWNGASQTITLAALNNAAVNGYLTCKVPLDLFPTSSYFTIEFRRKTGWDQGIPQDAVLIHERRTNGLYYLIRANGGAQRLAGQSYENSNYNVAITVLNINSASSTATVNIGRAQSWVDFSYSGFENGSSTNPFNTFTEGINSVAYNKTVYVKAGYTPETATISAPMRIEAVGGTVIIGQ